MACDGPGPTLVLDGPDRVRVEALGPVPAPDVRLSDGSEPDGVLWTVSRRGVARVDGDQLVAVAPGEVEVVAAWGSQQVHFTLEVHLSAVLLFVDMPPQISVGERVPLLIEAKSSEGPIPVGDVAWVSSKTGVLKIEDGTAIGVSTGTAYVTARARGSEAMAELEVVAP